MNDHLHFVLSPLLPPVALEILAACAALAVAFALYRRARGALGRALVFALLLLVLANPSVLEEQREPLPERLGRFRQWSGPFRQWSGRFRR